MVPVPQQFCLNEDFKIPAKCFKWLDQLLQLDFFPSRCVTRRLLGRSLRRIHFSNEFCVGAFAEILLNNLAVNTRATIVEQTAASFLPGHQITPFAVVLRVFNFPFTPREIIP